MLSPILLTLLCSLPAGINAAADARLNDVCFIDAQHGWAVGDRGVIWHTDDAGRRWQQQNSNVQCNLQCVCFLNTQLGWAVGRFTHPYSHTGNGVVLTTTNGGQTWNHNPQLLLPALRQIGLFNPRQGWAIACRSAMYPSGVFATDDAGQSWRPIPGANADWTTADCLDPRRMVVAGRNGSLAVLRGGNLQPVEANDAELRAFARANLVSPTGGWLIGEGGLVQNFRLLDASPLPTPNLPKSARHFDFAALAVHGPKCWIAGSPGTRVFHTADDGRTWSTFDTGTALPLRAMTFVDDEHGWAVGELGAILATADGGKTWQQQRAGGSRAALLVVVTDPDDVPLELIARVSGNDGCLSVVELLGRRDVESPSRDDVPLPDRLHEAVVRAGGCAAAEAWQFPLRQSGLRVGTKDIVAAWDHVNDGRGLEALRARVVRQIRLWRPEAIVIDDARREEDDPLISLVYPAVIQAIAQAGEANAFPDQIAEAGLKPWQVRQVYSALPPGARGANDLTTAQFMPGLGRSLAEAVAEPRGLLQDRFSLPPATVAFRSLAGGADAVDRSDLLTGLGLPPAGEARRELPRSTVEGLDTMQRIARKRRNVLAILDQSGRTGSSAEQLISQIDELTRDLDPDSAGQILNQLANQYHRSGQWRAAAQTYQALVNRYPQHPLTPSALLWLVHYHASAEAAWQAQRDVSLQSRRLELAIAIGTELERTRLDQFLEPSVRFPLAAAHRGLGRTREAERLYRMQNQASSRDAWTACAQSEMHLADPKGHATKPVLACVKTRERPHLDGKLDDPMWRQAKSAVLQSAQHDDAEWPAEVLIAHDDEFLYLGIRCREAAAVHTAEKGEPVQENPDATSYAKRPRDADLSNEDRVEIFLDLDRDYSTYYRLVVDRRGWTNDSFWGNTGWNPTWFVAARQEKGEWTVEAAIPLAELTGTLPQPGDLWAVGLQRIAPGVGFQSWTTPAAITVLPDGFGYLKFE